MKQTKFKLITCPYIEDLKDTDKKCKDKLIKQYKNKIVDFVYFYNIFGVKGEIFDNLIFKNMKPDDKIYVSLAHLGFPCKKKFLRLISDKTTKK